MLRHPLLATFVSSRWAARLAAEGTTDAPTWAMALGSGTFPAPPDVVARRFVDLAGDARRSRRALDLLEGVLTETIGNPSPQAAWWGWFGELHGSLSALLPGSEDLRLAMAFDDGELASAAFDEADLEADRAGARPVQRVVDALVETARRAVPCDRCEFRSDIATEEVADEDGLAFAARAVVRGGGIAGTLEMCRDTEPFDGREKAFLHAVAAEAGFALEAFALADRSRLQANSLALLYQVSCQLQVGLDLETVLSAACGAVCTIVRAERAVVLELRADGSLARLASHHMAVRVGPELGQRGLATSLAKKALATRGPVVASVDELAREVGPDVLERLGVRRSLGCVPLRAAGQPVGLVFFDRTGRQFDLGRGESENCETVANLAALAIERVRLHHAAKETARLHERERIAHELHDSVSQQLFRVGIELRRLAESDPVRAGELDVARGLLADASAHLRRAVREELPARAREALADEVRGVCAAFAVRASTPCDCEVSLPAEPPEALALLVERFAAEALMNVEKHAGATYVRVEVGRRDMALIATVADDGVGWHPQALDAGGSGLRALRDEAWQWGGELTLESSQYRGAAVSLSLPWVVRGDRPRS